MLSDADPLPHQDRRARVKRCAATTGGTRPEIRWEPVERAGIIKESPEIHRQRVLDPMAEQIRHWAHVGADRGELSSDALARVPLLLLSPTILATVWNGLYPDTPMAAAASFDAVPELVFGPPG